MNSDKRDSKTTKEQSGQRKGAEAEDRQARQAQALRENLRKRKAQVRARRSADKSDTPHGSDEEKG